VNWRMIQRVLNVSLIVTSLYVANFFFQRSREKRQPVPRPQSKTLPLSPDYYVVPPKSYVRDLADVRAFAGKPLWVREGYRWLCPPGKPLGPMEKVIASGAYEKNGQVWLKLGRGGQPACSLAISSKNRFFLDEIFFIKDPHGVYRDWSPDTWNKIAARQIEPEMTQTQITFALGMGELVPGLSETGGARTVIDYTATEKHLRVTYAYGVAKQVERLP